MLKTSLCELISIKYPIFQGGMAYISTSSLVSAVSNAGALGIIGTGMMTAEELKIEIKKTREKTSAPFGVNVLLLNPQVKEIMQVIYQEEVPVVTTGAGNPAIYIKMLKEKNIKVIPVVSSVALAKRLERAGIDAVIAEGMESGGHIGEITTFVLVPQIVDALNIPVIAAGGIFDGRGLVAALSLGAVGIQMGTRFICAEECPVHNNYKQAIIKAKDRDTVVTGWTTSHPVRCLRNKLTKEFEGLEKEGIKKEEIEELGLGKLKSAIHNGDVEFGSLMAGQCASMVKEIQPAKEIIQEIIEETENLLKELPERFLK